MKVETQTNDNRLRISTDAARRANLTVPEQSSANDGDVLAEQEQARWSGTVVGAGVGFAAVGVLVLVWWAVAVLGNYPAYLLPTPLAVGQRMWEMLLDGSLLGHVWTTSIEAGLGFLLA